MASKKGRTAHLLLAVILFIGLVFQYIVLGYRMQVTLPTKDSRSDASKLLMNVSLSSLRRSRQGTSTTTTSTPSPSSVTGGFVIDWSGINATAVNDFRNTIKQYIDGKLAMIVYKRKTPLSEMIFQMNVTQLEKANVTEYLPHQDTCAIIGNSGILLDSGCGREIDAHDLVVRANSAPTLGYERDVGAKTSVMMFNQASSETLGRLLRRRILAKEIKMFQKFNDTIVWYALSPSGRGGPENLKSVARRIKRYSFRIAYSINTPIDLSRRLWNLRIPTTGLNMFSSMVYYCDKISLYGFFPFYADSHGRHLQHHYFEKIRYSYRTGKHVMPYEFETLTKLRDSGVLRLVSDRCDTGDNNAM